MNIRKNIAISENGFIFNPLTETVLASIKLVYSFFKN